MRFRHIVFFASLLLLTSFGMLAYWFDTQDQRQLEHTLSLETDRLVTAYEISQADMQHLMSVLAISLAQDPEVISTFVAANKALQSAAPYSDQKLALAPYNHAMLVLVQSRWQQMFDHVAIRQMQFILPGTISLLRLHAPDEFGDSLRGVRPMLEEVEHLQRPLSGFELGRAFAGLRSAVPVEASRPDGQRELVGIIELGMLFDGHISRLGDQTGVGYGILLLREYLSSIAWEGYRKERPERVNGSSSCCELVAASRGELARWLDEDRLELGIGIGAIDRLSISDQGRHFQLSLLPLRDYWGLHKSGDPIGMIAIWQDVTAKVAAVERRSTNRLAMLLGAWALSQVMMVALLALSRHHWQLQLDEQTEAIRNLSQNQAQLLDTVAEGIYGVDHRGMATFANPAACSMLGFAEHEILGKDQHALFHNKREDGRPYPRNECPISLTLADGERRGADEWFFRSDGSGFPVRMTVTASASGKGDTAAVVAFHDITDERRQAAALLEMATTDALTGLANRRRFFDELTREIARFKREGHDCAVMMCDLDHFKRVNDRYGHAVGDDMLKMVATMAGTVFRSTDLIGRVGGEEFAILLPDCSGLAAATTAERFRQAIANARIPVPGGEGIGVTISSGVTMLDPEDTKAEDPLKRADDALYTAKASGRNCVVWNPATLAPDFSRAESIALDYPT